MSKLLKKYLKEIQTDESIFPIDSPHTGKGPLISKKTVYPESIDPSFQDKKRIMIDLDGVIHNYNNGWQDGKLYGNVIEGSKEAIDKMKDFGFEIVIFTTRASNRHNMNPSSEELVKDVEEWLQLNNIYYDRITAEKLGAVAYIDDRAIRFTDWDNTIRIVEQLINM
jgi:hypothetical protein